MKSLKVIQTIAKVLRIICKVMFIICIVGASCCLLGAILVATLQDVVLYEDVNLEILLADKGTNVPTAIVACVVGLFVCGAGIALAKYTELFFEKELNKGTPFDKEIVKDMRILGFVHLIASVALGSTIALALFIIRRTVPDYLEVSNEGWGSFWFGAVLLLISLFCEYGAEKSQPEVVDVKPSDVVHENKEETK